jgi:hypothetical protein
MTTDLVFEIPRHVYDSEMLLSLYLQTRGFTLGTFFWEVIVRDDIAVIQVIE